MELIVNFPQQQHHFPSRCEPRVSFADCFETKLIENLSYTYKADLWFSDQEIKSFKYKTVLLLRKIKSLKIIMTRYAEMNIQDTSTFVGLKYNLSDTARQETMHRREIIQRAFLSEQPTSCRHLWPWKSGIYLQSRVCSVSKVSRNHRLASCRQEVKELYRMTKGTNIFICILCASQVSTKRSRKILYHTAAREKQQSPLVLRKCVISAQCSVL